jgi:nucleoside-diphosphate-sugar epimerase
MILVTGGAGYVGSITVRELQLKGYAVRVFDKFLYGTYPLNNLPSPVDTVEGDILTFDEAVLDGVDAVIHLAGLSNDPTAEFNPPANKRINTDATGIVAEACKRKGIQRFIFGSSCSVYDKALTSEDMLLDEESPVGPKAAYGSSKLAAENILLDLADDTFCPTILRQGTVYGWSPRMRYDLVVNTFVKCAFQTGKLTVHCGGRMWRPLIDVTDVAKCYIACIEAPLKDVAGQIFNVSYKNYQILDLAMLVKKALEGIVEVDLNVEQDDQPFRNYRVSTQKIETMIGYRATVPVDESARKIAHNIQAGINADFDNPKYYNIKWLELLVEIEGHLKRMGNIF